MKRLGFLVVFAFVISFSLATFQAPERVFAQTTTVAQSADYSQKKAQGLSDINAQIAYLRQRVADPVLIQRWGGVSDPRWQAYVAANARLITTIQSAIVNYNTNFDAAQQRGANPDASYMAALLSVITVINNGATTFVGGPIRQDIDNINRNLNNLVDALRQTANASGDPALQSAAQQTYNQVAAARAEQSNTPAGKCTSLLNATFLDCIDVAVSWIIKNTFLQIAGFLLWAMASLLNFVVQKGILQFAIWAPDSLYPIWVIVRQIISLFVVFAGLWLGFMYIIGKGDEFKKYVPWIILFGLFVNFSYPLTRSLIDVSNVVALNVYASTVGTNALTTSDFTNGGPGSEIVNRMGLGGLIVSATKVNSATGATTPKDMFEQINSVPGALMAVVFVGYSAWVFFMATALLIARTAVLVFLIVASPLLFVDSIIPKLGPKAAEMRQLFFSQLVVAPIFMIMLALTLKFLDIFSGNFGGGAAVGTISGTSTIIQFFNILMMLIMLQITLKVTKNVSGSVGEFATKTIGQVGGFAAGGALLGTGMIARGTIGRMAGAARDSKWVTNNQNSFIGRRVYDLSNSVASSTFDLRNNSFVKTKTDKIGLNMGMGSKLNYQQTVDNRVKDRMQRYERIQTRYKKDEYDEAGKLIHRAGDINQDGLKAAAAFRNSQGRTVTGTGLTGAVKKADRFIFNKKTLWGEFDKNNDKLNQEDKQAVEKEIADLAKDYTTNAETGRATTIDAKKKYLDDLEVQINTAKEIDPELRGVHGQALVKSYKDLSQKYLEDLRANDEQEKTLLASYTSTDGAGRARMTREAKDDKQLLQKMNIVGEYLSIDNSKEDARDKKVEALLKLDNSDSAKAVIDSDTFNDVQTAHKAEIEQDEAALSRMARFSAEDKKLYDEKRTEIETKKQEFNKKLKSEKDSLLDEYNKRAKETASVSTSNYTPDQSWVGKNTDIPAVQRKAAAQQRVEQFNNPDVDITEPNQEQQTTTPAQQQPQVPPPVATPTPTSAPRPTPQPTPAPRPTPQPTSAPRPLSPEDQASVMARNVIETARTTSLLEERRKRMASRAANDDEPTPPTTPSGGVARPSTPSFTSSQVQASARNPSTSPTSTTETPADLRTGRGESSNDDQFRKAA